MAPVNELDERLGLGGGNGSAARKCMNSSDVHVKPARLGRPSAGGAPENQTSARE
jgi:hypothetical protein